MKSDVTKAYNLAFAEIIRRVREMSMDDREWSPTPKRKRIEDLANKLDELAAHLARQGSDQFDIELEHDRQPEPEVGEDGWPCEVERPWPSYKATIQHMRDLAASARRVAAELPNPRGKRALPFAAMALLHLRYELGFERPALSDQSADVFELKRLCESAGIVLSDERLRGALSQAMAAFDPKDCPYFISRLLVKVEVEARPGGRT